MGLPNSVILTLRQAQDETCEESLSPSVLSSRYNQQQRIPLFQSYPKLLTMCFFNKINIVLY
jgi:hypothetical protein